MLKLRRFFSTSALFLTLMTFLPSSQATTDPLSKGPLPLNAGHIRAARNAFGANSIYTDEKCHFGATAIAPTEVPLTMISPSVCQNRTQELVYLNSIQTLVGCARNQSEFAIKVAIGTGGYGKTTAGDRKIPGGTYWIGHPRASKYFGIFIPIGYPNRSEIAAGYTGSAVGVHGPTRFTVCLPHKTLESNWTAGCLAMGRDTQMIALSEWLFAHWPVKITFTTL